MSARKNGSAPGKGRSGSEKSDLFSFESLLDEIESEEKKVTDSFPDMIDAFDDDLDDIDDIDRIDDIDDLDELGDLDDDFDSDDDIEPTDSRKSEAEEDFSTQGFWDEPDDDAGKPAGIMDSLRSMMQGGKNGKSNLMPVIIIALLVIIILLLLLPNCNCGGSKSQEDWFDTSAIEGTLPGKSPEEIQAMLNQIVEEGMFNISISPVIVFENPQAQGQARIENIPANHYHMSVKITLDDTSETIYESKGIRPGQYIEYITLQKELQSGEYAATALFSAYDADTLSEQGRVAVKVKIIVE